MPGEPEAEPVEVEATATVSIRWGRGVADIASVAGGRRPREARAASPSPEARAAPGGAERPSERAAPGPAVVDGVPSARVRRAREAGEAAGRKVEGEAEIVPPTPKIPERNRWYCVILNHAGEIQLETFNRWSEAAALVRVPDPRANRLSPWSVCHGFPSLVEARAYYEGAGFPWEAVTRHSR